VDTVNQTIVVADIAGFGSEPRTTLNFKALQDGMYKSLKHGFAQAGISWDDCYCQKTGDGALILAPAEVAKGAFAGVFLTTLADALRAYNETHPVTEQIKLRLVLHAGEITHGDHGPIGPAIIHAHRLLAAQPLKDVLASSPGPLAVIVSNWFLEEVVRQRSEYESKAYRKVVVEVKETTTLGWIRVPGHELPHELPVTQSSKWREVLGAVGRRVRRIAR
jgi:hypothetical protein